MVFERKKNVQRNLIWACFNKMVGIILPFLFRTVMIRTLGAEYVGVNSLFTSVLQVLSLSELGFSTAMVFSMYKPIAENNNIEVCALLSFYKKVYFYIGCVIMSVGAVLTPFIPYLIAGDYPSDINIYFVFLCFLTNTSVSYFMYAYRGSLLNALQRNDLESKVMLFTSIFRYTFEIIGIYLTHQYYLFLCIELFSTILSNLLKYWLAKRMYPEFFPEGEINNSQKAEIKRNVTALMFHKIGGIVLNSADTIVLSAFMGVIVVANYSNYYYIMNSISSVINACFSGITAGVGNSFVTEGAEKNRDNFRKILFFNAWLVGWSSTCLLCLYQDFINLWIGEQYMFSDFIVLLFVIYFFIHSIRMTIIIFRDGAGMWRDNRWQPIVSATFNLTINIILVHVIGVAGILISSIASMLIIDIPWETYAFCKRIEMKMITYLGNLLFYFIISAIAASVTLFVSRFINFTLVLNLFLKAVLCVILPNLIFLIAFFRRSEFKWFSAEISGRFRNCKDA